MGKAQLRERGSVVLIVLRDTGSQSRKHSRISLSHTTASRSLSSQYVLTWAGALLQIQICSKIEGQAWVHGFNWFQDNGKKTCQLWI